MFCCILKWVGDKATQVIESRQAKDVGSGRTLPSLCLSLPVNNQCSFPLQKEGQNHNSAIVHSRQMSTRLLKGAWWAGGSLEQKRISVWISQVK